MRVLPGAPLGARDLHLGQPLDRALEARPATGPVVDLGRSASCRPTRIAGFSEVIGSWKTSGQLGAEQLAVLGGRPRPDLDAVESNCSQSTAAGPVQQAARASARVDFAAAGFADHADPLAGPDLDGGVADGLDLPG